MLLTAEQLLSYQRCRRRTFLDIHGDLKARDSRSDFLLKLQQERSVHQQTVLAEQNYHQPDYSKGDWEAGAKATIALMQQGVDRIHHGVLIAHIQPSGEIVSSVPTTPSSVTLISRPDFLIKQPGQSIWGDWIYTPAQIELGKRPKLEYQIVAAYNAQVLAAVQGADPPTACLILRTKSREVKYKYYVVRLANWVPQMQRVLEKCIQTIRAPEAPEVFIARQRCSLCRWYGYCYALAKSQQHLSLLPGVTPSRYTQLQDLNLTSIESLANASSAQLKPVLGNEVAQHLVLQAQSVIQQRPILLPKSTRTEHIQLLDNCGNSPYSLPPVASLGGTSREATGATPYSLRAAPIELYFDIEAEPDLNLDYLLGVLVIDHQAKTETFHSLLAERPEAEGLIWQQFLDLVWQYPLAPIFHFCSYEVDTVKRLAKLYHTPKERVQPLMNRFVDVYEQVTQTVALPVESYTLKAIARWLGFDWRDPQANGSQCIYWYDRWLDTSDRTLLDTIQRYNEDDCRATRHVKDWLVDFVQQNPHNLGLAEVRSRVV